MNEVIHDSNLLNAHIAFVKIMIWLTFQTMFTFLTQNISTPRWLCSREFELCSMKIFNRFVHSTKVFM